ncbi:MAG: MobA/MobL family protein [Sphingobacterium sp.]|jgi:hypothetical protein|nr:MobA/MobL family protein [Sphingobacterium sp.]
MTKLSNVKGRINYISSSDKQENLYSVMNTIQDNYWKVLAEYNQQEFRKSGTSGKCIEARELIIALPECFVDYKADIVLKNFTNHFKKRYEVECISALHYNKKKSNYHIHLIFSERKSLSEPEIKIATRSRFYNEEGSLVRTKKEITDVDDNIRKGCKVIPKGGVYEHKIFSSKETIFKSKSFLEEIKLSYTDLINSHISEEKDKLQVYDRSGPYLPTKKIGKNNPKKELIQGDNELRMKWNIAVDVAYMAQIPRTTIIKIKKREIVDIIKESKQLEGNNPNRLQQVLMPAIESLEIFAYIIVKLILDRTNQKVKWNHFADKTIDRITTVDGRNAFIGLKDSPTSENIKFAERQLGYLKHNMRIEKKSIEKSMKSPKNRSKRDYDAR